MTWLVNMLICVSIPKHMYQNDYSEGFLWLGNCSLWSYLIISYILEIVLFLLLTDASYQNLPDDLSKNSRCGYKLMRLYFISGTAFQSFLLKATKYTAISLMLEFYKRSQDVSLIEYKGILLLSLFIISIIPFISIIMFPFVVFTSLLFKQPEHTFDPVAAHTTRLLSCADLKLLSKYVERYAINYYGPLLCWNQSSYTDLSKFKTLFEDTILYI